MTRKDYPSRGELEVISVVCETYLAEMLATSEVVELPSLNSLKLKCIEGYKFGLSPLESIDKIHFWHQNVKRSHYNPDTKQWEDHWLKVPVIVPHASLLLVLLRQHPSYDYEDVESDEETCTVRVWYSPVGGERVNYDHTLTRKEADDSGISMTRGKGGAKVKKRIWQNEPAKMLRWATVRQAVRLFAPDVWSADSDEAFRALDDHTPIEEPIPSVRSEPESEPEQEAAPEPPPSEPKAEEVQETPPKAEPKAAGATPAAVQSSSYAKVMAYLREGESADYQIGSSWKGLDKFAVTTAYNVIAEHHGAPGTPPVPEIEALAQQNEAVKVKALLGYDASKGGQL